MFRRFNIALCVTMALAASLVSVKPATAVEGEPTIETTDVSRVAKGAAVQVEYDITCPPNPMTGEYAALWTRVLRPGGEVIGNWDYLEFDCGPDPRRIVNVVPLAEVSRGGLTIETNMTNCLYFDSTSEPIPGCFHPADVKSVVPKPGRFVPDTWHEQGADIRIVWSRLTANGKLLVTNRVKCDRDIFGYAVTAVRQVTRGRIVSGQSVPGGTGQPGFFECFRNQKKYVTFAVEANDSMRFKRGAILVDSRFLECEDGFCAKSYDSKLLTHRDRNRKRAEGNGSAQHR